MKFEEISFPGKERFTKSLINRIYKKCTILTHEPYSELAVKRYLEILISDQDFNIKSRSFYDKNTGTKISDDLLVKITLEYVNDHVVDFIKSDFLERHDVYTKWFLAKCKGQA